MPIAAKLLAWYDDQARALPWRSLPGAPAPDPYRVWLSEIMLQQTSVAAVKPYFERFTARWPGVTELAAASDSDVMAAWAGLGYYARARNLLACASAVIRDHGGRFPDTEDALRALPGVGAYTAAAIAAIAFGKCAVVVDGNVERVVARLFAIETPLPAAKAELRRIAATITPGARAGDFAQAMMDLGRTVCTPRSPACVICPLIADCRGAGRNPARLPARTAKSVKPERVGTAWWIEREGDVLLVRRPAKGLLGGMRGLPGDGWCTSGAQPQRPIGWAPAIAGARLGCITHVFTHFRLTLTIAAATLEAGCVLPPGAEWWRTDRLSEAGLPSVFAKAARAARREASYA